MKKSLFALVSVVLCGCAANPGASSLQAVYDFGLPEKPLAIQGSLRDQLQLEVKAPSWFDALSVDYRLAYDDPLKLREYAQSRWVGAPTHLLKRQWQQLLGVGSVSAAECTLRVELQEFSQVFSTPSQSQGVLLANVTISSRSGNTLAHRFVSAETAASAPDAQGGVKALVASGRETGVVIGQWLIELERQGDLKKCSRKST